MHVGRLALAQGPHPVAANNLQQQRTPLSATIMIQKTTLLRGTIPALPPLLLQLEPDDEEPPSRRATKPTMNIDELVGAIEHTHFDGHDACATDQSDATLWVYYDEDGSTRDVDIEPVTTEVKK